MTRTTETIDQEGRDIDYLRQQERARAFSLAYDDGQTYGQSTAANYLAANGITFDGGYDD
jgi:hypothetical protein